MNIVAVIAERLEPGLLKEMVAPVGRELTATEAGAVDAGREAIARRVAEQIVATVRNVLDERAIEDMCRAHDEEEAAQKGEPSPWREDIGGTDEEWMAERRCAMLCALKAVGLA